MSAEQYALLYAKIALDLGAELASEIVRLRVCVGLLLLSLLEIVIQSSRLGFRKGLAYHASMLIRSDIDITEELRRDHHPTLLGSNFGLNHLAARAYLLGEVERPQHPCNVDEHRSLCDVDARTDTATGTVGQVIPFVWVRNVDVGRCW